MSTPVEQLDDCLSTYVYRKRFGNYKAIPMTRGQDGEEEEEHTVR